MVYSERTSDTFYVMVQITQRDNAGNLITYFESDTPKFVNLTIIDQFLDGIANENDPIFLIGDDIQVQVISRDTNVSTDSSGLLSSIQYFLIQQNHRILITEFTHDGMRLNDDEHIEVNWIFVKYV